MSSQRKQEEQNVTISQTYSGPIPPPEHLARYEQIKPGLADEIMALAKNEQAHRHKIERMAIRSFSVGPWLSALLGLSSIVASTILYTTVGWTAVFIVPAGLIPAILSRMKSDLTLSQENP